VKLPRFRWPGAAEKRLQTVASHSGGSWGLFEPFGGAWQRGFRPATHRQLIEFAPLWRCVTLIAGDLSKLGVSLVQRVGDVWQEAESPAFSPVLRKPNRYQTWNQLVESWALSRLLHGNAYVHKVRDSRGVVVALYVLDPAHVQVLTAPGATVLYQVQADNLSTVDSAITLPASEIIHDRMNPVYHPLCGLPPLLAASLSGSLGREIQQQSEVFYRNGSRPGGILTSPNRIDEATATRLKSHWEQSYSGDNLGRVAVAGDGLTFSPIAMKAVDAQLVEHLRLNAEMVACAFGVPLVKLGLSNSAAPGTVEADNQRYFADCLQKHIEDFEWALSDGLQLPVQYDVKLDISNLYRMDPSAQMAVLSGGVSGGIMTRNEARRQLNLPKVLGGDQIWAQQQDFPIALLAETAPGRLAQLTGDAQPVSLAAEVESNAAAREQAGAELMARVIALVQSQHEQQQRLAQSIETRLSELPDVVQVQAWVADAFAALSPAALPPPAPAPAPPALGVEDLVRRLESLLPEAA